MKKLLFLLTGLLFSISLFPQQIKEGPPVPSDNNVPMLVIGKTTTSFYVLRADIGNKKKRHHIEEYSLSDLSLKKTIDINIENEEDTKLEEVFLLEDRFLIFRSGEKEPGIFSLFMQTVMITGEQKKEMEEIFAEPTVLLPKIAINKEFDTSRIRFYISASTDMSSILFVSKNETLKVKGPDVMNSITAKLLDTKKFTQRWKKQIPNTYGNSRIASWNYKVDAKENIYFNFNYLTDEKFVQGAIGCIHKDNMAIIALDLKTEKGVEIDDVDYKLIGDKLYCSGITKKYEVAPKGKTIMSGVSLFSQIIDLNGFKILGASTKELPPDVLAKVDVGTKEVSSISFSNVKMDYMEVLNDELYSVAEIYYPYGPLLVFKTNKNGEIEWINSMNKRYSPAGNGFQYIPIRHYHFIKSDNNFYIVYNENPRNAKSSKGKFVYDGSLKSYKNYEEVSGSHVVAAKVGSTGILERKIIYQNDNFCLWFVAKIGTYWMYHGPLLMGNMLVPLPDGSAIIYLKHDKGKGAMTANLKGDDKFAFITFK